MEPKLKTLLTFPRETLAKVLIELPDLPQCKPICHDRSLSSVVQLIRFLSRSGNAGTA
jgi:hypothetical protein